MEEKELIKKIQQLREIKPSQEWVVFARKQILGQEAGFSWKEQVAGVFEVLPHILFPKKLAYASATFLIILIGMFGFAQNTVPGDLLFSIKKVAEETQKVFVSSKEQPKYSLEIASKRLEDLTKITEGKRIKNIAPALNELEASLSEAAKGLAQLAQEGSQKDPEAMREIGLQVKKLEENKQRIESLGIKAGGAEELENALAPLVQQQIKNLEESNLTEVQQKLLDWARIDVGNNDYSAALIKIWQISNLNI